MTRFIALICILPLFAQSFYYLLPVAPLYYLSKVWPVLHAARRGVGPDAAAIAEPDGLRDLAGLCPRPDAAHLDDAARCGVLRRALTTTVKVWPFTYYFSLLGVLCWLRPTARQISARFWPWAQPRSCSWPSFG